MATNSAIEWTEATWNPIVGCSAVSPGCTNCYAMRLAHRLEAMGQPKYQGLTRMSGGRSKWTGEVRLDSGTLEAPKSWRSGRMIFVNSMSDLFHEGIDIDVIKNVFSVMSDTPQHTYQILTKRSDRLASLARSLWWPNNVWMGVSVESEEYLYRVDDLRRVPAGVRFLSLEPLLGPLPGLNLDGIDWVIAGGESGPGARPIHVEWARSIRDLCSEMRVPFHFKQWGGVNKKKAGRILDGRTWDDFPSVAAR